ncbi:methyltransferase domain-containing protein [Epibacterium sp. SM1969]|uniref:Methyltransferase domain-containing protein n=1 Tax=Tritonibacter aquimaris TaxID=2663379 RepID=A0A844APU2_9RHOB|nr:RsmB/NOP family class I SAM-dependent RNA methyltransferase [Tritonibacter aquimaris]MQY41507.1 methyltransferase domain-containing protein [Tritonibacter aquimaris]
MTPGARLQAAIEVLDQIIAGMPAEKALTTWSRKSRFAGSKDRAAVRDHVFSALRCWRSHQALGGSETGRGLILGGLRDAGIDPDTLFNGEGHAPQPLNDQERNGTTPVLSRAVRLDLPDWIWPAFEQSLGDDVEQAAQALRHRAPVHLRVNVQRASLAKMQKELAAEGIETQPHAAAETALEITEGARKLRNSKAYQNGLVELQDAASQAVVEALPLRDGMRVLDYCAGGGGKSLAMAARAKIELFAHDANFARMKDLPERAKRAGSKVQQLETGDIAKHAPFDLVLCDVPCSGSGSWRRAPEGKWALTAEKLAKTQDIQAEILRQTADLIAPGGTLAYATCSMLNSENQDQVAAFIQERPEWRMQSSHSWRVHNGTDGFFVAVLTREVAG